MDWTGTAVRLLPFGAIVQWWKRPILHVYFDPQRTYEKIPGGKFFCHFMVRNDGRTLARRCRARLMTVSRIEGEGEVAEPAVPPRILKWANEENFDPIDIDPGVQHARRCDLVRGIEGSSMMHLFVAGAEVGVPTMYPKGKYRLRVRVDDGEHARHTDAMFDVTFTGDWAGITVVQVEP